MKQTRQVSLTLLTVLSFLTCLGQDSLRYDKVSFQLQLTGAYKTCFGNNYIEPTDEDSNHEFGSSWYHRFNIKPSSRFSLGALVSFNFNENWALNTGVLYAVRNEILETSRATVLTYGNFSVFTDLNNISTILKYDYVYHNLEIPLFVEYNLNKLHFYLGVTIPVLTYKEAKYLYLKEASYISATEEKQFNGWEIPVMVLPTIQVAHTIQINSLALKPFVGFGYGVRGQEAFHFQLGVNLPLETGRKSK